MPTEDVPPRQQRLARLCIETDGQRPVGRLQHLGHRSERRPAKLGGEGDQLAGGDAGVLGVATVERAAHPTHHRRDLLSRQQHPAGRGLGDLQLADLQRLGWARRVEHDGAHRFGHLGSPSRSVAAITRAHLPIAAPRDVRTVERPVATKRSTS
jgi:hypothetical protein